jgi:hypothetical protein
LYTRALQSGDDKLIWTFGEGNNKNELYDMSSDPSESRNRFADLPITSRAMRQTLLRHVKELGEMQRARPVSAPQAAPDEKTIETLKALGYAQ